MSRASKSLSRWKFRHFIVTWIGIVLNWLVAVPLFFCPEWMLAQLNIPDVTDIWPRAVAGLWFVMTCFYIPMTIDIDRYRLLAWLAILPGRALGALFLILAVLFAGVDAGFLLFAAIEAVIAITWLHCMINIVALEQAINTGREG